MSDTDSFIEEVTEEVRRDRLFLMMRRYGWIAVAAVIAIVGAAAWNEWSKEQQKQTAQAFGDAVIAALSKDDSAARLADLEAVGAPNGPASGLLEMIRAGEMAKSGDATGAAALYAQVAADSTLTQDFRDIAQFKGLLLADMASEERRAGFEAMAANSVDLRLMAEEQLALIELTAGNTDAAIDRLTRILQDASLTGGMFQRVTQLLVALGIDPEGIRKG